MKKTLGMVIGLGFTVLVTGGAFASECTDARDAGFITSKTTGESKNVTTIQGCNSITFNDARENHPLGDTRLCTGRMSKTALEGTDPLNPEMVESLVCVQMSQPTVAKLLQAVQNNPNTLGAIQAKYKAADPETSETAAAE